ncbi:MAG: oxidase [Betaproteobacteria bacterium]|nr:MAG: oxidase [Betaproteobacteria bacterium]
MKALALRSHLLVWFALLALLASSAGSALLPLGMFNLVSNFAIAIFKAALVLYFFMRIGKSRPIVRVAAAAGIVWLALLCGLALSDVLFRTAGS